MSSVAHIVRRRRSRKQRNRSEAIRSRTWTAFIVTFVMLTLVLPLASVAGATAYVYNSAASTLPARADSIELDPMVGASEFYDRDGSALLLSVQDPLGDDRSLIPLDALPQHVIDATLIMEDPDYLQAGQFNLNQTLSRLWRYMLGSIPPEDLSISGRLTRNALIPQARSSGLDPELLAIVLGAELNRRYLPETVLEWHLNTNYYGNDAYGIETAAQVYLGKSARELSADEAALLAAIPPEPQFNPFDNETAARGRQADLLLALFNAGTIDQATFDEASARITPLQPDRFQGAQIAPEFSLYARQQVEDILTWLGVSEPARVVSRGGLRVTTTLDLDLYYQTECTLRAHLAGDDVVTVTLNGAPCAAADAGLVSSSPVDQGAESGSAIVLDVATGQIRAWVGDAEAVAHQPGPTLHPFVYFQGFRSALFTPATMVLDIPQPFPGPADGLIYTPTNPDGQFRGPLNLRDAMAAGLLPPAAVVANSQGMSRILSAAHRIGLNSMDETSEDLSLLERGGAVSVLDMAYAYSVFAASGVMRGVDVEPIARGFRARDPVAVLRIEDASGDVIWSYDEQQIALSQTSIFEPGLAFLVNDILSDDGTRSAVLDDERTIPSLDRRAAIVSGAAGDSEDHWTIGYTPQMLTAVHLSRSDDATVAADRAGLDQAAPVWHDIMRYINEREAIEPTEWTRPDAVVEYVVCEKSGLNPGPDGICPTRTEYFLEAVPPQRDDSYWQRYEVNSQTGQLATANTPASLRSDFVFFIPPSEAMDWWMSNGQPLPPTDYDTLSRPEILRAVQILEPADLSYVGGTVTVRGSIEADNMQYYQLAYGRGLNPSEWFDIGGQQSTYAPDDALGTWDTRSLDGIYTLQLTVVYEDNSRDSGSVQVTIDNIAPELSIMAGEEGQIFRLPDDSVIPVMADVSDNLAIDRVEFFHNGQALGVDEDWPYGFEFDISRPGVELFRAEAYDQVGNSASSEIEVEVVRGGG